MPKIAILRHVKDRMKTRYTVNNMFCELTSLNFFLNSPLFNEQKKMTIVGMQEIKYLQ